MEKIVDDLLGHFEHGRISRRQLVHMLALGMTAATAASRAAADTAPRGAFKAVAVNHISFGVADYARTRDFYADLLGMEVSGDDGKQCYMKFGKDSFLIPRRAPGARGRAPGRPHLLHDRGLGQGRGRGRVAPPRAEPGARHRRKLPRQGPGRLSPADRQRPPDVRALTFPPTRKTSR